MIAGLLLPAPRPHNTGTAAHPARSSLAAFRTLRAHTDEVIALARTAADTTPLLAAGARVIAVPPEAGVGDAVAAGVSVLMHSPGRISGCIVASPGFPLVRGTTLKRLAEALRPGHFPVVPHYRGTGGHPLAFPAGWFPRLVALRGDQALADLLAVHRDLVLRLAVDDPAILPGVDRPALLEMLVDAT